MSAIPLTRLKRKQRAKVLEITAGKQAVLRLSTLGIRPGVHITKVSAFALKGPVTLRVARATIALGHAMAEKVFVEPFLPH